MALLIRGKSLCPICGKVIAKGDEVFSFPALITNPADRLHEFNDSIFHSDCFYSHPLSERAEVVIGEWEARSSLNECAISGREITGPDDFFVFPFMTDSGPLAEFNFACCSREALKEWRGLPSIVSEIRMLLDSGEWEESALLEVVEQLKTIAGD